MFVVHIRKLRKVDPVMIIVMINPRDENIVENRWETACNDSNPALCFTDIKSGKQSSQFSS